MELPYEEITPNLIADSNSYPRSSKEIYKIPFEDLLIREGFNKRKKYDDIEELAASIAAKGLNTPLDVDILSDGRVFIEKGHRRYMAIKYNIKHKIAMDGVDDENNSIDCYPNNKNKTEMQRMEDIYTSNMHSSTLHPIEQAAVCFDLKNNFGKISSEEIGNKLGISRAKVDYLLLIANADDSVKNEILNGNMNLTEAVAHIRLQKMNDKQAYKAELDANKNSASLFEPKDSLHQEMSDLNELNKPTDEEIFQQQATLDKEYEDLMNISDEIKVRPETLPKHIGRKLSANAVKTWKEDFVDEDNEVVPINHEEIIVRKGDVITEQNIQEIIEAEGVDTILVYKKGCEPVAKSVITVVPEGKDKDKYDMSRPEIEKIQKAIQAGDKIAVIVSKLDVPEQTKNDLDYQVHWLVENLVFVRDWCHKNKKQNKIR